MLKNSIRDGFHTITPYLIIKNAGSLLDFLKQGLGAVETYRALQPNGHIKHAEVRIGTSMLMVAEAPNSAIPMPCNLYLYVEDVDFSYARALQAGAISVMEPNDRPTFERLGGVCDTVGNIWWIASLLPKLSPIENPGKSRA